MGLVPFSKIAFILYLIPAFIGGLPFVSKSLAMPRNGIFLSLIIGFIFFFKSERFKREVKSFILGTGNDINQNQYQLSSTLIILTAFILYLKLMVLNTINFELLDQDFSYFDLMLSNFMKGNGWFSEACNCNHMGVHSTYWFYLLAPLHSLFKSPFFLQIVHGVSVALALVPIKKLLDSLELKRIYRVFILFTLLNYSGFMFVLKYDAHFESFYLPLFLWVLYYLQRQRWGWFHFSCLLILAVKEDAGFYLFGLACSMLLKKGSRIQALALITYCLPITFYSLKVFIPEHRGTFDYVMAESASKYGGSISEILKNAADQPLSVLKDIFTGGWVKTLIPFLFIPLIFFSFWVATGPFIFIHSIASRSLMRNIAVYYGSPFYPFLIFYYLKAVAEKKWGIRTLVPFFLIATLVGSGTLVYKPYKTDYFSFKKFYKSLPQEGMDICAQAAILPHLGYEQKLTPLKWCDPNIEHDYIIVADHLKDYGITSEEKEKMILILKERGYSNIYPNEKFKVYSK